jgi:hypothetical protein
VLAHLRACAVAREAHGRGRGRERGAAARRVACEDDHDFVRLHGLPSSIVSDRDLVFISKLWQELFALVGIKLNLSSTFHPQSDGQSEATNKMITMYLHCITGDRPWL